MHNSSCGAGVKKQYTTLALKTGQKFLLSLFFIFLALAINAKEYQRIVSLAPSLTKNIYYLESQAKLVGCTQYCEEAKPDNIEIVASAIKINLEKVVSMRPDLVLATTLTSQETIETLQQFGIHVEVFPTPDSFESICTQFNRLGKLIGKSVLAEKTIKESKSIVDSLVRDISWDKTPKIFFQIGAKPLYTVIPNTFMDDYIQLIKAENIASDLTRGSITRESVIVRNPDYIFIVTMGIAGDKEKDIWEGYSDISATKNKNIFIIDSDMACTPTPISFVNTIKVITQKLAEVDF